MEAKDAVAQETVDELVKAAHGNLPKVRELAEQHPSIICGDASWKETPMEAAAHTANKAIVGFLLSRGVPLDVFAAIVLEKTDQVSEFLRRDPLLARAAGAHGIPILFYAAAVGNTQIGELLLANGADVNAGADGITALHGTAQFGNPEFAEWLLAHGADVSAKDYTGKTPLAVAMERGQDAVATVLRRHAGAP